MDNVFDCVCQLPGNHREIGCFFKYVIFLMKRFVSYMSIFKSHENNAETEMIKNQVWMQIATEYDNYYTGKKCLYKNLVRISLVSNLNRFLCIM